MLRIDGEGPVGRISDYINIDALFTPAKQSKEIDAILGDRGEYVAGPTVEESYGIRTLRVEKKIRMPLSL